MTRAFGGTTSNGIWQLSRRPDLVELYNQIGPTIVDDLEACGRLHHLITLANYILNSLRGGEDEYRD